VTNDEIDRMEAGPELDAMVAVAVFGWEWFAVERHFEPPRGYETWRSLRDPKSGFYHFGDEDRLASGNEPIWNTFGERPPKYSTEIAAAWQVVERMKGVSPWPYWFELSHRPKGFMCNFVGDTPHNAYAESAPLAICKAALRAVAPPADGR